jgi:hypothetical protein
MAIEDWNGMRKTWVRARDAAKPAVGMGAVKGVKLGESIEGVYKAASKDYAALHAATKKLLADIDKYTAGIKAKNPNLVTWIDTNLEKRAKTLLAETEADVKALQAAMKFYGQFNARREAYVPDQLLQIAVEVDQTGKPMKTLKPKEYKQLQEATKFYESVGKVLEQTAGTLKLKLLKTDPRPELKEQASMIDHYVKVLKNFLAASDGPRFAQTVKATADGPDILWGAARTGYGAMGKALGR